MIIDLLSYQGDVRSELTGLGDLLTDLNLTPVEHNTHEKTWEIGPKRDSCLDEVFWVVLLWDDIADKSVREVEGERNIR